MTQFVKKTLLFSCSVPLQVFKGMSLGDLQAFITEQEKLSIGADPEMEGSPVLRKSRGCLYDNLRKKEMNEHGKKQACIRLPDVSSGFLAAVCKFEKI